MDGAGEGSSVNGRKRKPSPWNLFAREQSMGAQRNGNGPPDTKVISDAYSKLTDDEFKALQKRCDDAQNSVDEHGNLKAK
eukprot:2269961-Pyramimonas_sp.AAC.1